jgi:hypothetical protein
MDNITRINQFATPTGMLLEPPESSKPILTSGYELRPCLINMVQEQSFSGEGNENPYTHLQEFEQIFACLQIAGMSHETLKSKLFPFSLMGEAKHWYTRTVGSVQGDWEALCCSFCLSFFPISRVVSLRIEVLTFKQKEKESLGAAWACFNDLVNSGPDLAIQDHMLLQHFYMGLSGETAQLLDTTSGGSFLHCSASEGREILSKILENTPYTSIHVESPKDVVETTPEEEPMIVEPKPLPTPLEASTILQVPEPPKEEEIPPLEDVIEFEDDLFSDCGNTSNYLVTRKSSAPSAPNQHLPNPPKRSSSERPWRS